MGGKISQAEGGVVVFQGVAEHEAISGAKFAIDY